MKNLHLFISRLDAAEKKYFRRYGLKSDNKTHSQSRELFELLESFETFDEEKIHNRIKRLKLDKQIAHTKIYLFDLLTETITWYNRVKYPGLKAAYDFAQIQLLEEKGLQVESDKMLAGLLKQNTLTGTFTDKWQSTIIGIQQASNSFLSNKKIELKEAKLLLEERNELLQQMFRYHQYDTLLIEQLNIIRKAMQARNADDLKALTKIFENDLVQNESYATSVDSKFVFHTLRIQHFSTLGKMKEVLKEAEALRDFYKKNQVQQFSTMRVLWTYATLTQACHFTQEWEKLDLYLTELLETKTNNRIEAAAKFNYHTQLAVSLLDHKKNTAALKKLLEQATEKLKEYKHELRPDVRLATVITCASAFVEYGEYEKAIDVCEDFLTNYDSGIRLDVLLILYTYQFISHLELGNTVYVNNVLQNVNRYFIRNEFKGKFETTMLKTFKKISEAGKEKLKHAEITALMKDLQKSAADVSSPQNLALLPIIQSYLESKLT